MEATHLDVSLSLESICSVTAAGDYVPGQVGEEAGYLTDWSQIRSSGPYSNTTWSPYPNIANNPNLLCALTQTGRLKCWHMAPPIESGRRTQQRRQRPFFYRFF